jgi:predicted ATPase/DNA-binding SARP family transcriptional activator
MNDKLAPKPWLRLRVLGGCELSLADGPLHLETAKTRALLIYLSMNPGPQPRHTLMTLLWGDLPETNARRNLRRALWNLRRELAAPEIPPPIRADREMVCFNREMSYTSDVEAFEAVCYRLARSHADPPPPPELDRIRRAVEYYRGEFLEGFHVDHALAFEEWALVERERLRTLALQAFGHLMSAYAARNDLPSALEYARRQLALEPWLEDAHRWAMRLLATSGQRAEALAHYETCKRVLSEELGVEPGRETQALYNQIREGAFETPASNLPASTTPFVGRASELSEIAALLNDADCRLLTITGLGGVGKTRLAQEVAAQQGTTFAHGVHYIDLGAVGEPSHLARALTVSLRVPIVGMTDPEAALLAYLHEKTMLMVLDRFEHLIDGAPLLVEILEKAPGIKILVTSRERLNLCAEWVYRLTGMDFAPDTHVEDFASFDAEQLFLQTARRAYLGFQVKAADQHHLVRLCALLAGLPLAIELAASWVRVLSLEEIVEAIAEASDQPFDLFSSVARDRPARHRSIRAVFDQSWALLSKEARTAFRRLSVFRGGFRRPEALKVTEASPQTLLSLVDQSLIQRLPSGRFQIHELLRQYAQEKLNRVPDEATATHERHSQAYAVPLGRYKQAIKNGCHLPIQKLIREDVENVLIAWEWAVEHRDLHAIEVMRDAVADSYHLTTSFREGEALFRKALERLEWTDMSNIQEPLPCKLLCSQATFSIYLGQLSDARASLEHCLPVFEQYGDQDEMAYCRFFLGEIARFLGDLTSAQELFTQSLTGYRQAGNRSAIGFSLNGLGQVAGALGAWTQARSYLQQSLASFKAIDHEMGQAIASINLADLLIKMGDYTTAKRTLASGYALCHQLGHRWGMAICLSDLGDLAQLENRPEAAKTSYQESLRILQDIGQRQASASVFVKLGKICADLGELDDAGEHFKQATAIAIDLGDQAQTVEGTTSLVRLMAESGDPERGLALAMALERHLDKGSEAQRCATTLVTELTERVSNAVVQRIRAQNSAITLQTILSTMSIPLPDAD